MIRLTVAELFQLVRDTAESLRTTGLVKLLPALREELHDFRQTGVWCPPHNLPADERSTYLEIVELANRCAVEASVETRNELADAITQALTDAADSESKLRVLCETAITCYE